MHSNSLPNPEILYEWLTEAGLSLPYPEQFEHSLRSSRPNVHNLTSTIFQNNELNFAVDGMPLVGAYENSYVQAPREYRRDFQPYPRKDSPTRQQASEDGARINAGADRHLSVTFKATMTALRGIVAARRHLSGEEVAPDQHLDKEQAADVVKASTALWSYLIYRKRVPYPRHKLPAEVGLLYRSMAGVQQSLFSLYFDSKVHAYRVVPGYQDQPFTADNWLKNTEESGLLVARSNFPFMPRQMCVAPTSMIGRVMETIIEPLPEVEPEILTDLYGAQPDDVINFGREYFTFEHSLSKKARIVTFATERTKAHLEFMLSLGATQEDLAILRSEFLANLVPAIEHEEQAKAAFDRASKILGYVKPPAQKISAKSGKNRVSKKKQRK